MVNYALRDVEKLFDNPEFQKNFAILSINFWPRRCMYVENILFSFTKQQEAKSATLTLFAGKLKFNKLKETVKVSKSPDE